MLERRHWLLARPFWEPLPELLAGPLPESLAEPPPESPELPDLLAESVPELPELPELVLEPLLVVSQSIIHSIDLFRTNVCFSMAVKILTEMN